mmetsp:Transcript_27692/g.36078  ORF Transcript_27692/g.36078 Transcript_27692/m.36078 type:complete len:216 (-) Transcript_27692:482-1129(-)
MTKDDMLPIQVGNVLRGDEKLTSIGTWTGIGHTELSCLGMFDNEIFIGKFFTENRFSSCTISGGKVTPLNHKILDDTMEGTIFVMQGCTLGPCSFFSRTKSSEIFSCFRNNILVQLHDNPSKIFLTVLDIKKDMWIITLGVGNNRTLFVVIHTYLSKQSSIRCLFFLFVCSNRFLETCESLTDILVGFILVVGCHKICLGFLQQPTLHFGKSTTV